jgi:hypothetical protein
MTSPTFPRPPPAYATMRTSVALPTAFSARFIVDSLLCALVDEVSGGQVSKHETESKSQRRDT